VALIDDAPARSVAIALVALVALLGPPGLAAPRAWAQAPPDAGAPPAGAPPAAPPDASAPPDAGAPPAAPPAGAPPAAPGSAAPGPTFEPPRARGATDVPYPAAAPAHSDPVVVTVKLTVDATGAVQKIDPVTPPQPIFDEAVAAAARTFQFEPATYGGNPVPVEITFTHTFLPPPPPPPPAETGPPRRSVLRGKLVQLGTRAPVQGATVTATIDERSYSADADARGRFELPLPEGRAAITVTAPGHNRFLQQESASSAARRCRGSRCAPRRSSRSPARSATRFASSRRCPAWRRWCRCCRSRSSAARRRVRPGSCSTARASRCSITCCRAPA
jgi:TonB family protein